MKKEQQATIQFPQECYHSHMNKKNRKY